MGLLGRKIVSGIAGALLVFGISVIPAEARGLYPIIYGDIPEDDEHYIMIKEDADKYEVVPGDSLWKIAEELWGDGSRYTELAAYNQEIVPNPDFIYPGMLLDVNRMGHIRKEDGPLGFSSTEYCFDAPYGWTVGMLENGGVGANFTFFGRGQGNVACLVQGRMEETAAAAADWEKCVGKINKYVQSHYADTVKNLSFEHYQVNGEELYLYSYGYVIEGASYGMEGELEVHVCAGLRLSEHIQAEYLGFGLDGDIHDIVRYMAASFEELEPEGEYYTMNMAIYPDYEWEVKGMYNSFAWIEGYFDAVFKERAGGASEKRSIRERLLETGRTGL